ncbi:MAG: tyrosine-protein phosphatase [Fusicatenibacter sp.]
MKLIRENSHLFFDAERDGEYAIELPDTGTLLRGKGNLCLPDTALVHPVYKVIFEDQETYIAEQLVQEVHITNFRDIGGYRSQDGRQVRYGCFYRSAPITFSADCDRQAFQKLGMKHILDLRSNQEAANLPDETISGCNYVHCSAIALDNAYQGNFDMEDLIQSGALSNLKYYILEIYQKLPFHNEAYRKLFDLMLHGGTPLVFHCTAGKDRTGFAAYLILKTLGVPDDCILYDYMQSNVYRKKENQTFTRQMQNTPGMDELLCVKEEYLKTSIQALEARYGDFETYVKAEYEIGPDEITALKNRYLYRSCE